MILFCSLQELANFKFQELSPQGPHNPQTFDINFKFKGILKTALGW